MGNLTKEAPTIKVKRNFDHVTNVKSHENLKIYGSTFARLMAIKVGRMLTSGRRFSTETLKLPPTSLSDTPC